MPVYCSKVKSRIDVKTKNVWRRAKNTWLPFSSSLPTVQKLWFATGEISEEKLIFFRSVSSRVPKKCDDFLNTTFERLASSYRLGTEMPTSHNHHIAKCRFLFFQDAIIEKNLIALKDVQHQIAPNYQSKIDLYHLIWKMSFVFRLSVLCYF